MCSVHFPLIFHVFFMFQNFSLHFSWFVSRLFSFPHDFPQNFLHFPSWNWGHRRRPVRWSSSVRPSVSTQSSAYPWRRPTEISKILQFYMYKLCRKSEFDNFFPLRICVYVYIIIYIYIYIYYICKCKCICICICICKYIHMNKVRTCKKYAVVFLSSKPMNMGIVYEYMYLYMNIVYVYIYIYTNITT